MVDQRHLATNGAASLKDDLNISKKMLRAIMRSVATTRKLQNRVADLQLFGENRSAARDTDHPLVQLMVEHASLYAELKAELETAPDERAKTRTTKLMADHLSELGILAANVQKDIHSHVGTAAKLVSDAAKIANMAVMHTEKIELAKKLDPSNLSDAELLEVINSQPADDDATPEE